MWKGQGADAREAELRESHGDDRADNHHQHDDDTDGDQVVLAPAEDCDVIACFERLEEGLVIHALASKNPGYLADGVTGNLFGQRCRLARMVSNEQQGELVDAGDRDGVAAGLGGLETIVGSRRDRVSQGGFFFASGQLVKSRHEFFFGSISARGFARSAWRDVFRDSRKVAILFSGGEKLVRQHAKFRVRRMDIGEDQEAAESIGLEIIERRLHARRKIGRDCRPRLSRKAGGSKNRGA